MNDELRAIIEKYKAKDPSPRSYRPPDSAQIAAAQAALGARLPDDYLDCLVHAPSLGIWLYRIAPNGDWEFPIHDIVEQNVWRRKRQRSGIDRYILITATGGDGGYDAFDVEGTPKDMLHDYRVVHIIYTTDGIMATPISKNFREWLRIKTDELPA